VFTQISLELLRPLPVINVLPCSPLQLSVNPVHMNVGSDNHAILFAIDKRFVQADTVRWCLARNTAVDKMWEAPTFIILTIHSSYFAWHGVFCYEASQPFRYSGYCMHRLH